MLTIILAIIIIIVMIPKKEYQVVTGNVKSMNFEICPESRAMFEKMVANGVSGEQLRKFVMMEDKFLEYEKDSVCRKIDRVREAGMLDQAIREEFGGYDFTYHSKHIKQISEQNRIINPNLKCWRT